MSSINELYCPACGKSDLDERRLFQAQPGESPLGLYWCLDCGTASLIGFPTTEEANELMLEGLN